MKKKLILVFFFQKETVHSSCDRINKLVSVKGDCRLFEVCANNMIYTLACKQDLVFDEALSTCNRPEAVKGECGRIKSKNFISIFQFLIKLLINFNN
jgi:hypothetical protein